MGHLYTDPKAYYYTSKAFDFVQTVHHSLQTIPHSVQMIQCFMQTFLCKNGFMQSVSCVENGGLSTIKIQQILTTNYDIKTASRAKFDKFVALVKAISIHEDFFSNWSASVTMCRPSSCVNIIMC